MLKIVTAYLRDGRRKDSGLIVLILARDRDRLFFTLHNYTQTWGDYVRLARTWWTQPVSQQKLLFPAHPCRPSAPCCRPACCVWPARCAKQTRQAGGGCPAQYDLNIITSIGISITLSFDRSVFDRRGLTSLYYLRDVTDFLWPLGVVDDSEAGDG